MNKPFLVSFLAVMTAISGITYYTLQDKEMTLRGNKVVPSTSEVYTQWLWWLQTYGKTYQHDELPLKFNTFKNNYVQIKKFNAQQMYKFTVGLNQFADLDNSEFATLQKGQLNARSKMDRVKILPTDNLPASVDWRTKNAVTPVKNQGQCGSCWAFSTTGSLEGLNALHNGNLLSFSEQQLVDCSSSYGNQGCNGGLMDDAFQYVEKYGIELESTYPYTGQTGTCQYSASDVKFKNTGYQNVAQNNSAALQAAVAQQPVSIAIEADSFSFQFYSGGVFDDAGCGTNLDHGVLIVGYGTSNGQAYWIVKNSWGASWGMNGYIEIANVGTNSPGICGINMEPSYPTL